MKVLALTHAHLNPDGLSPVSCERTDSITGTWGAKSGWQVDVVHTKDTKWRGIWPDGKGLKINIIEAEAPGMLVMGTAPLFAATLKAFLSKKQLLSAATLIGRRIAHRAQIALADNGLTLPHDMKLAAKWGAVLAANETIKNKKYDFLFVCVGYGDEYLLQTASILSKKLHIPLIADFRDLWSEHHDPHRFTLRQQQQIRRFELKLLANAVMISVPQKHMKVLLDRWINKPVYLLSHSAYIDKAWQDGQVISNEFTMLYAGKLYAAGPGIKMLLELLQKLSKATSRPFRCRFFVDDAEKLQQLAEEYNITAHVEVNGWIGPDELWKNLRSAHLLPIPDPGVAENYPLLPTKTFQYAATGRQILGLLQYPNQEMNEFLTIHNAGMATTKTDEAVTWVAKLMEQEDLYTTMPPLRPMPFREQLAEAYGTEIEKIFARK